VSVIIDRTSNSTGKSLPNRQRYFKKEDEAIKRAVKDAIDRGKIGDVTKDGVKIRGKGLFEPHIHHNQGSGDNQHVVPGNKTYVKGDKVNRPPKGGAGQGPGQGGTDGDGEDDFEFTMSKEEFLEYFLSELELPDLAKTMLQEAVTYKSHRAGYSIQGNPSALNIRRTMRNAMGRRIALNRPGKDEMQAAQDALLFAQQDGDIDVIAHAQLRLEGLQRRSRGIPYVDPIDLRFNRFEKKPEPNTSAVMFCLMDVSGSMDEQRKDIAKRFFILLNLFLERQYDEVKLVFIRHTHEAEEVDEDRFFHDPKTGGTVVSTALQKMIEIQERDYPLDKWNIYVCQASDGDSSWGDDAECLALLQEKILPRVNYFAYIEAKPSLWDGTTMLWACYDKIPEKRKFQKRRVNEPKEIFSVLADLFEKRG
jgi:uncharacterized sporulation protein YeaH/YhbH (DUF444 family)